MKETEQRQTAIKTRANAQLVDTQIRMLTRTHFRVKDNTPHTTMLADPPGLVGDDGIVNDLDLKVT